MKRDDFFSTEKVTRSKRYLHTPGKFARENLLYVQEIGKLKSLTPHRCVREDLDSFLFLIVLSGKGSVIVGEKKYEMKVGDCVFINCMEHYEHISDETDGWELAWVHFNGGAAREYHKLFEKYVGNVPVFKTRDPEGIKANIEKLMDCQKKKDLLNELQSGELLLCLINHVIENVFDNGANDLEDEHSLVVEIREYLNENFADTQVLEKMCKEFDKELNDLNNRFQTFFGIDLMEYVWNRRLNSAKELLRFSIKSIEEVGIETGIIDANTMQRMFQEEENMSPEEYRMKWAQWIRK